jgi:hypothetical protein
VDRATPPNISIATPPNISIAPPPNMGSSASWRLPAGFGRVG